jgi:hypothetical protein
MKAMKYHQRVDILGAVDQLHLNNREINNK